MKIKIKKMPDKKTLQGFLQGMVSEGSQKVIFDNKKGKFVK